jgi:hypothetical protein
MKEVFLILTLSLITNLGFCQETVRKDVKTIEKKIFDTKLRKPTNDCENKEDIEIKAFQIGQGWGFDILVNNKKYIHQTNIPAINGKKTFKTKEDAMKIAGLMKSKMCKNILPPSITLQEIDNLITKN